jgi:hypothetical protein
MKFVLTYVVLIYYTMSEISPELIRSVGLRLQHIPKCIIYDIDFDRRGISGAYIYILFSFLFISLSGDRRGGMGAFLLMPLSLKSGASKDLYSLDLLLYKFQILGPRYSRAGADPGGAPAPPPPLKLDKI